MGKCSHYLSKIAFALFFVLIVINSSKAGIDDVVEANNRFCFDLYSNLSKADSDKNIFFSPYNIFTVLAMVYEGAKGETAKEMGRVFYFPIDNKTRREGIQELISEINKKDKKYQLHTANTIWVEKTYKLLDDYLKVVETYYHGKATHVGFMVFS